MKLMVMTYVTDMARSVAFYETLGLKRAADGEIDPMWNEFAIGDATLALHVSTPDEIPPADKHLQLNLNVPADGSLVRLLETCKANGVSIGAEIEDLGFGRFFWITDPDGLFIQINQSPE